MDELPVSRMSRPQFWGSFAVLLVLFLVVEGPIWAHPWDLSAVNRAILLSYAPIPLLVAGCLFWSRRLRWVSFFLDTLSLTLLKYSVTFAFALFMWGFSPEPASAALAAHSARAVAEEAPAPVSVIPDARRGAIHGVVTDAAGHPAARVSVFVDKGLEDLLFAPRAEALTLLNDGTGIEPRVAIAQVGQRIEAHAADGQLHTLVAVPEDKEGPAFLVPLMKSGAASLAIVREPHAALRLKCTVHTSETPATLVVLAHPFFTTTDETGHFALEAVPAAHLAIKAIGRELATASREIDLAPRGTTEVSISLP